MRVGVVTVVLATTLMAAQLAYGQVPTQDRVTGTAIITNTLFNDLYLTIDASSGPSGENPTGFAGGTICSVSQPPCTRDTSWGGDVTCLNVRDNRAVIGFYGHIHTPSFADAYRERGLIEVVDNGTFVAGPDRLHIRKLLVKIDDPNGPPQPDDFPITDCPDTAASYPPPPPPECCVFNDLTVFEGALPPPPDPDDPEWHLDLPVPQDFTVTNAKPPLPTSKQQCMNGGWKDYGIFKNQGDCVSFVATGGKNPPTRD